MHGNDFFKPTVVVLLRTFAITSPLAPFHVSSGAYKQETKRSANKFVKFFV